MPIRSYAEMQAVMRRVEALVHKYLPDYTVELPHPRNIPYVGINLERKKVIRLNADLIAQSSWKEIEDVVLHEIAHSFQYSQAEHSKDWKNIAKAFGSTLLTPVGDVHYSKQPPRFLYRCATCGIEFESPYMAIAPRTRGENEPPNHPLGHTQFYIMDTITREKWMTGR